MRVDADYPLPSLEAGTLAEAEPGPLPPLPPAPDTGRSFRQELRRSVQLPPGWAQQLRLDMRPHTATYIGPPPRPRTVEISDAETQRARWRNMVARHSRTLQSGRDTGSAAQPVHVLLDMLVQMQRMEDAITSTSVAVTRG